MHGLEERAGDGPTRVIRGGDDDGVAPRTGEGVADAGAAAEGRLRRAVAEVPLEARIRTTGAASGQIHDGTGRRRCRQGWLHDEVLIDRPVERDAHRRGVAIAHGHGGRESSCSGRCAADDAGAGVDRKPCGQAGGAEGQRVLIHIAGLDAEGRGLIDDTALRSGIRDHRWSGRGERVQIQLPGEHLVRVRGAAGRAGEADPRLRTGDVRQLERGLRENGRRGLGDAHALHEIDAQRVRRSVVIDPQRVARAILQIEGGIRGAEMRRDDAVGQHADVVRVRISAAGVGVEFDGETFLNAFIGESATGSAQGRRRAAL